MAKSKSTKSAAFPKAVVQQAPDVNAGQFEKEIKNSFDAFVGMMGIGLGPLGLPGTGQTISQTYTLYLNLRWYLISNNRQLLSQSYVEHGLIQTLVDQPVDDGFATGFDLKTDILDKNDIEDLMYFAEQHQVIHQIAQAWKWARLYGGGAILIITSDDMAKPLDINKLKPGQPFRFKAIDMWELYDSIINVTDVTNTEINPYPDMFNYYGIRVHPSRVLLIKGKEAPSFVRPRLRGWGMSEVERLVRSINQYLKNQDVVFELLDEAKVDVYSMKGFNAALSSKGGTTKVAERVQGANQIKNFQRAIVMDKDDDYEQKQMSFSGLSEILTQIRQGVACDMKMPITKLFGVSASGFNSGEDDIENYNSMINTERSKIRFIVVQALQILSQLKFGVVPDDLKLDWKPLRILGAEEEERVKNAKFNRVLSSFQSGLATAQEAKQAINKDALLPIEIDETSEAMQPINGDFLVGTETKVDS